MRRMVVVVVALLVAVAGAACDRTDQEFGEKGVVRVGIAPDDLVGVPEGELVQSSFLVGHRPGTSVVEVSEVDVDGRTSFTAALPSTFTSPTARGAVVGFDEPRDP